MPSTLLDHKFNIGETVYIRTDPYQLPHVITYMIIYKNGEPNYGCKSNKDVTNHYDFEISREVDESIKINFGIEGDD